MFKRWKVKKISWLSPLGWHECRNIESFPSQMFDSSQEPTWCRDVMKRRGPLHNQKRSQVAMDTKWGENRQAKLQKKKPGWLVSRYLSERKQRSLFRSVGSCAAEGQLKSVISWALFVLQMSSKRLKRSGEETKKGENFCELFPQRTAQPSSTFSLSPEFNSNYRNWTIYYLAVMGKCARWS